MSGFTMCLPYSCAACCCAQLGFLSRSRAAPSSLARPSLDATKPSMSPAQATRTTTADTALSMTRQPTWLCGRIAVALLVQEGYDFRVAIEKIGPGLLE